MKKNYRFLYLVILLTIFGYKNSSALVFVPEVYLSAGASSHNAAFYATRGKDYKLKTGTALNLAVGITPFNVPVANLLRLEAQYYNNFSKDVKINYYGLVAFFDLRLLPFITPYAGLGYHSGNVNFQKGLFNITQDIENIYSFSPKYDYSNSNNTSFYSLHVGSNLTLPIIGLSVFAEYKLLMPSSKLNVYSTVDDRTFSMKYRMFNHNIVLGIKYFIL